ncbi:MAG: trigger factor [Betaproteobacteria bacterium]|nr:MAG: trigger factor [Betaproteobacteria bacterium]
MQTSLENLGSLERRLNMAVAVDEIEKQVEQRLKKLSRTLRMAGFRPGKVPMKLVAQQYGPQVRSEVLGDAVQKAFGDAVREQNLKVAGYPRIEPKSGDTDAKSIEFSATFEIYPEVVVGDIGASKIERAALSVGDAEVDKTLQILRKQRQHFHQVERPAAAGDRITADFLGKIEGVEFTGGKASDFVFVLGEKQMLPEFESNALGLNAGASRTFELTFPADYHGKDVAGKTASFELTLKLVEEPHLPELDAEFARSLGVENGDLVQMRSEVKANIEREVKKRAQADLKSKVMQVLLDATKIDLPKALIEMETQRLVQAARAEMEARGMKMEQLPINPEMFEQQAQRRVSLGLIIAELVGAHDLGAKPEQVRALVQEQAESYEQPDEVVKWIYSQPQRLSEMESVALEDNVVAWVLAHAKVEEKAVNFDEFMGKAE